MRFGKAKLATESTKTTEKTWCLLGSGFQPTYAQPDVRKAAFSSVTSVLSVANSKVLP